MGKALILMVGLVLLVFALFDLRATPAHRVAHLPKFGWFVVIVFAPWIGPAVWLLLGQSRQPQPPRQTTPRGPIGPDDDPDFLRRL